MGTKGYMKIFVNFVIFCPCSQTNKLVNTITTKAQVIEAK